MKKMIIGIDPGKNGGIAVAYNGKIHTATKMPRTPNDLLEFFIHLGFPGVLARCQVSVYIENVHAMPTDTPSRAFTFGQGLGQIEGILAAMGLYDAPDRYFKVAPQTWMKSLNMKKTEEEKDNKELWKRRLKALATDLHPHLNPTLSTADAILITAYGVLNESCKMHEANGGGETKN